jgi:hypothetical protein
VSVVENIGGRGHVFVGWHGRRGSSIFVRGCER